MESEYHIIGKKGDHQLKLDDSSGSKGTLNGQAFEMDILETNTGFHVIRNGKTYRVDVLEVNKEKHEVSLRINAKQYHFKVKDKYDELLEKLGMDLSMSDKVSEIKAPMPGLVLDILIKEGDEVVENQPLIILEAMKMENVIKAPNAAVVKSIQVKKGVSVEKNELLIAFD